MLHNLRRTVVAVLLAPTICLAASGLPDMGPAPDFRLTTQDGRTLSLAELQGKVVLLAFIYASCKDVCLTETARMVMVQNNLSDDFGKRVYFLSVTINPEEDTGEVLREHARRFGARLSGWAFLTGAPADVQMTARAYGVAFRKTSTGDIEHNTVASIIDARGRLRVQYLGTKFDPGEMVTDLRDLVREDVGN